MTPAVAEIGLVSFLAPVVVAMAAAYWLLDWTGKASAIAGIALSTTSLAVVYAVLVESGLNRERLGRLLIFIRPNLWFAAFLAVSPARRCDKAMTTAVGSVCLRR